MRTKRRRVFPPLFSVTHLKFDSLGLTKIRSFCFLLRGIENLISCVKVHKNVLNEMMKEIVLDPIQPEAKAGYWQ